MTGLEEAAELGWGSAQTVEAVADARRRAWALEAESVLLCAHFADLHAVASTARPGLPGAEELDFPGGDGTPGVAEFAHLELAARLNVSAESARLMIGDALALRHRMPGLFRLCAEGEVRIGVARMVVREARDLGRDAALELDRRLAPLATGISTKRLLALCGGWVLELLPDELSARRHAEALEYRGVWFDGSHDGVTALSGQLDSVDAIFLDAQLDRVAGILRTGGSDEPLQVRRAQGLGLLASPARALQLLQASLLDEIPALVDDGDLNVECPARGQRGHVCGQVTADPEALMAQVEVAVHVDRTVLAEGEGLGRLEASRTVWAMPVLADWLAELVGHTRITVRPVLDPEAIPASDAYEVGERMRRAVGLRNPVEVFPGSARGSRSCDLDHTDPWHPVFPAATEPSITAAESSPTSAERPLMLADPPLVSADPPLVSAERPLMSVERPLMLAEPVEAPPTRADNLGPLSRRVHRAKTHGGWRLRQLSPGVFWWRSPDGFQYLVTPSRSWLVHNPVTASTGAVAMAA